MRYNNEVTKQVIIHDHTQALCLQLKDDYEEQIEKILQQAKTQAETIIENAKQTAEERKARMIATGVQSTKQSYEERRLAASYAERQHKEAIRQAYMDKAKASVKHALDMLPAKTKQKLAKKIYEDLRSVIKEEGYKEEDFTFEVYKELNIAGAHSKHQDIRASAKSGYLVFEDSLAARLAQEEDRIRQAASALID